MKQKGPGEQGARRNHPEILPADFPMTPMERTEHHFGPFWDKDFGAISGGPFFSRPLFSSARRVLSKNGAALPLAFLAKSRFQARVPHCS